MSKKSVVSVLSVVCVMGVTAVAQAAFVAGGPKGGVWDDFEDGTVDTVTWTSNTSGSPLGSVSEVGGQLKLVQTAGFNGAYSTRSPFNTSLMSVGQKARAIMTRIDTDDRVSVGFSITTNEFLRTCGDTGDYVCVTENSQGFGSVQARQFGEAGPNQLAGGDATGINTVDGTAYEYRISWDTVSSASWAVSEVGGGLLAKGSLDWSADGNCGDGSCWPAGLGVAFYHHNGGTLLVDEVEVYPEPASLGLLGVGSLLILRRRRRA